MLTEAKSSPLRTPLLVTAIFFVVAIVVSGVLPLWLDEILQLVETRNTTPRQLIHLLPRHPGASPLGYLFQQAIFHTAGYSVRLARFPSALFAGGTVLLTGILGSQSGLKSRWLGSALFAFFPLTLRYACESRTYAQALFFSSLASVLFVRLAKKPDWPTVTAYCLALTAAVYTQPYAILVGAAHILWAILYRDSKATVWSISSVSLAIIAFLPWYLWTKTIWASRIEGAGVHFTYSAKTPLMLFRELAGAGYWGSGLLLILFVLATAAPRRESRSAVVLLLLLIAVPAVLAVVADAFSGYFVATRQIMWVLPAVAVLAARGIEQQPRAGIPIALLLAAVCVWQNVRFFTSPREDWQLASDAISADVAGGACLVVVPAEEVLSYAFFRPELAESHCPASRTVVAVTPYATKAQRDQAVASLTVEGYTRQSGRELGKSQIDLYSR